MKKLQVLTPEIRTKVLELIDSVFEGEIESFEVEGMAPSYAVEYIDGVTGLSIGDDMDTNGWQYDYWFNFKYEGQKYCLSGSGYYGNLEFGIDKEEDDEDSEE